MNEGCRVIAEGIVDKPADLDVATVMAMGFPPVRVGGVGVGVGEGAALGTTGWVGGCEVGAWEGGGGSADLGAGLHVRLQAPHCPPPPLAASLHAALWPHPSRPSGAFPPPHPTHTPPTHASLHNISLSTNVAPSTHPHTHTPPLPVPPCPPPHLPLQGGLIFWADLVGAKRIAARLEAFAAMVPGQHAGFFKPCAYLADAAKDGRKLSAGVPAPAKL